MAAEVKYPSVKAGRIRCRRPPRPPAGSTPSTTAKNRISMSPSQNAGIDWPSTANTRAPVSSVPPRRTAEYMPERNADEDAQDHGHEPELDGGGQALPDVLVDRPPGDDRVPEVAQQDVLHIDGVLDGQRLDRGPRCRVRISWSRSVALTSSSRWTGLPDRRVKHEHDADHHQHAQQRLQHPPDQVAPPCGLLPGHVLPVVEAHVTGDQRPVAHLGPHARRSTWAAPMATPGMYSWSHGPISSRMIRVALLVLGCDGQPLDELVELGMLHEQVAARPWCTRRGREHSQGSGATSGRGVGQRHARSTPAPGSRPRTPPGPPGRRLTLMPTFSQ